MWLTCLTVIRFNSIQWESNSPPSSPHPRTCLRFQFNSFQWQCDAIRFDFVLIKSERLATSFSSVLFAAAPVEPVDLPISTCRCRCCHTVGKEINAYIYSITSVEAMRLNIYLFTFSIPILPLSLTSFLHIFWFARLICIFCWSLMKTNACGSVAGRSSALA